MNRAEIESKLIELAAEQAGVKIEEVTPATHFVNDLEFDSLDVTEYVMKVEDEFHVNVPDDRIEKLATVRDVTLLIEEEIKKEAPAAQ